MNERLSKKISIYNFIFTIAIVIYHCKNFNDLFSSRQNWPLDVAYAFYDLIGYIAMGFFFMISSYLFYLGIDKDADLYGKMKKRLLTLGIPFLVWNLLFLVYKLGMQIVKTRSISISPIDLLLGFSFRAFDGPLWYILALLLLMAFAPLIIKLKNHPRVLLIIVALSLIVSNVCRILVLPDNEMVQWVVRLVGYLPLYLIGVYFGLAKSEIIAKERYNYKAVSVASIAVSILIIAYFLFFKQEIPLLNNLLLFVLPITVWLSTYNSMFERASIKYPMKVTFFVYAMHTALIGVLNSVLNKIIGYNSLHPIVSFFAHFVFAAVLYFVCLATAWILGKILPKKLYFALSGGRVEGKRKSGEGKE